MIEVANIDVMPPRACCSSLPTDNATHPVHRRFFLSGTLPTGWTRIEVQLNAPAGAGITLHIDQGDGLDGSGGHILGTSAGRRKTYRSLVVLPPDCRGLHLCISGSPGDSALHRAFATRSTVFDRVAMSLRRLGSRELTRSDLGMILNRARLLVQISGFAGLRQILKSERFMNHDPRVYSNWRFRHRVTREALAAQARVAEGFALRPLISVIMPVYNSKERRLRAAIESVLKQSYPHWELCIAADRSAQQHVRTVLEEYLARDPRVRVEWRAVSGRIAEAANSALRLAAGDYVASLDHEDTLEPNALFEVVTMINAHPEADFLYSDEDRLAGDDVYFSPYFKPDWSPDLLLSQMYTANLAVYRRSLVEAVGGFRKGFEGAQDYDLVLRLTEKTRNILHIPQILYHRRAEEGFAPSASSKSDANAASRRALQEAIARRGARGRVEEVKPFPGHYYLQWEMRRQDRVSIIIPTRDRADLLDGCLRSIVGQSSYQEFEIVVVNNRSGEAATFAIFEKWRQREPERFRVEDCDVDFNYSELNNFGVRKARGELLLFLNNDTEVQTKAWLEEMAGQAQRDEIAAVGALLLYPNGTIQHAGVTLGIGNWAAHAFNGLVGKSSAYAGRLLGPSNFMAVTGACMMMRREVFERLGGFDEHLAVACNDIELCLRVYRAGFFNILLPGVVLVHHESESRGYETSPQQQERFFRETAYVRQKYPELCERDPFYNVNLTRQTEDFALPPD